MKRKNIIISCLILSLFIASFCIILSNSFSNNKNITEDEELIGTYIDGEYSENIPNKDTGYVVEKIVCDNNAVGKWDYDNWGITLTNLSKKNKCNIHFRKGVKLADTTNLVDTTDKCPTLNDDGTVNITGIESENSLLCSAPDNYGISYYYRGNVQNNYVKFANFYWRIVRINGDGSIRVVYDGTVAHENGDESEDRLIGLSSFNESVDDNAYVGYMYGTLGSSTYEETHANTNDSTVKTYVDNWYENNIKGTDYEEYIVDNIFCNSRAIDSKKHNGYGGNATEYNENAWNEISLMCLNKNDSLGAKKNNYTNGSLKYSISLMNFYETVLAGGHWSENKQFYLYIKSFFWTLTAWKFDGAYAHVRGTGTVASNALQVNTATAGVRPVINLKPNSLKFGDGTINNPYTVEQISGAK